MKKVYKMMLVALCAVLLVAASVMGTLAYLQMQTKTITNVMTVGKVEIELSEAKVDEYGVKNGNERITATATVVPTENNTYKLIPGHTYTKDPKITVKAGSEACWLFVIVENGIQEIESTNTIKSQMEANGWKNLKDKIWYYGEVVNASSANDDIEKTVFTTFSVSGEKVTQEGQNGTLNINDYKNKQINVTAYAVQSEGFNDENGNGTAADEAWNATFGKTTP